MFSNRVQEARSAAKFAKVVSRTREGDGKTILVPGHNGKQYYVIIRRNKKGSLITECRLSTPHGLINECKGNCVVVCYHSMAAIIALANERNYNISISEKRQNAKRRGGNVFTISNHKGTKTVYFTTKKGNGK